jgi:hypothetical protein
MTKFSNYGNVPGKRCLLVLVLIAALLAVPAGYARVLPGTGQVLTPQSSIEEPGDT